MPDVADGEHARGGGLQQERSPPQGPVLTGVGSGEDESPLVALDGFGEPAGERLRADQDEQAGGAGSGHLDQLLLRDRDSGQTELVPAAGLFILIGAQPFTSWLPEAIKRDQWGFILTGSDTGQDWPLQRPPFLLETTTPGVFAVGDVRHGSMKRVAAAVGDGSTAIRLIHDNLALAPPVREGQ